MAKKNAAKNSTTQLADDVLFGARVLYRELDDIFGHVSGRLPPGAKREGLLFARMRIAFMHTEIYKARPDVGGVVHAHPFHAVILSATGRQLQTFHPASIAFGNGVPLFRGNQINTEQDGREVAETLGQGKALILKNHGAVTVGQNVADAVVRMYYLERAAYAHLIAGKDLAPWTPDSTYLDIIDQSYKFLWRTWHWELESGGAMARWERKIRK